MPTHTLRVFLVPFIELFVLSLLSTRMENGPKSGDSPQPHQQFGLISNLHLQIDSTCFAVLLAIAPGVCL